MSHRKAAPLIASINTRPMQTSMALVAVGLLILLNCIQFSSSSSISSSANQQSATIAEKVAIEEDVPRLEKVSQPVKRAARQYNFGLGKRDEESINADPAELSKQQRELWSAIEFLRALSQQPSDRLLKRSKPQRFQFGIGKRTMEEVYGDDGNAVESETDLADGADKRKAEQYHSGISKRSRFGSATNLLGSHKKMSNFEEFMKRRYSFGLGKRSV